jgi:hypothetical protein
MAESVVRNRVNLLGLYQNTFGYIGVPFPNASVKAYLPNEDTVEVLKQAFNGKSVLGTPIFMPITIDGYTLPNTPIVSIRGSKTIIETKIDNADGTFKEGFSLNDYEIMIQGIAIDENEPDLYPEDQVREIRRLFEERRSLKASNDLLTYFGIEFIVIYDLNLPGEAGAESYQPYTMKCKSDKEYDLEIEEAA